MHKNWKVLLFVVLAASIMLAACNNPRAESAGVWYWPPSWGDQTLAQTLSERCVEGASQTQVGTETYPCNGNEQASVKANEGDTQTVTLMTDQTPDQVNSTGPTTREEADLVLFGRDENGAIRDILVQIGTESWPDPRDRTQTVGGYQFNTANEAWVYNFVLPKGWFATMHRPGKDKAELFVGDGKTEYTAWRLTVRNPANYPVADRVNTDPTGCELLAAENQNALSQEWEFSVLPGNVECDNAPTANVENNAASNRTEALPQECPTLNGQQLTAGNDGSPYCVYDGAMVTSVVPAGWKAEVWTGEEVLYANAGDEVTFSVGTFRPIP